MKKRGTFKLELKFYLRAKLEKVHRAAGCKGVRKQSDIVTCHRRQCFRSSVFHRARSHPGKKKHKGAHSRNPGQGRKEREEEGKKWQQRGFRCRRSHCCLQWKHPGVIRRDLPSGFHHLPPRMLLPRPRNRSGSCWTPCLNNTAGIRGRSPKAWAKKL